MGNMQITLGQPVHSTDGPFGELADVVVDPSTNTVTHVVVEPHHRHYQARLVPMSLMEIGADRLTVQLDEAHLRSLQGVAESDFGPANKPIDLGDQWDVGIEHVVVPYDSYGYGMTLGMDGPMTSWSANTTINYDRIPKGECEIRHDSAVMSSDRHQVGVVAGLVLDDDIVEGVVVQSGAPGFQHVVTVPLAAIGKVRTDQITLDVDRAKFRTLTPDKEPVPGVSGIGHRVVMAGKHLARTVRFNRSMNGPSGASQTL